VIRAHQAAAVAAIVHNLGREPIWRSIYCGLGMASGQGDLMWYWAGADLVVVVHLLVIGFIVGGVFLTWRWPPLIWAHIPAVIYGALVEFAGFTCPLTLLENDLRQRAGDAGYRDGFIAHYLVKVIYPPGLTHGDAIRAGCVASTGGDHRILGLSAPASAGRGESLGRWLAAGTWGRAPRPAGGAATAPAPRATSARPRTPSPSATRHPTWPRTAAGPALQDAIFAACDRMVGVG
jgi:hypothetical protein